MRDRWWLALFIVIGFALNSWSTPLFDLDEGAFSEATLEMLHSGNYVTTTLNGEPRYDKPMLSYWLQAASVRTLGKHELAFRLPSLIAASLWMLLLYGFVKQREDEPRQALIAAAALAFGLMSSTIGHAATADAILNLLIASAGLDIYRWYEQPRRSTLMRVYVAIALGLLTKGPIAAAIPGAASLLLFASHGRFSHWLRAVFDPLGWLILLVIVMPWVYASYQYDHGEFLRHFLLDHNLGRYSNTLQGHGGHWWYYLAMLPLIVLPFTGVLRVAFARGAIGGDSLDRYCLVWFVLVLLLFSGSSTQLPHYLLYGCTPLFILIGRYHARVQWRRLALLPPLLLIVILATLPWLLPAIAARTPRIFEHSIVALAAEQFGTMYVVLAALAVAAMVAALWLAPRRWSSALLLTGLTQALLIWGLVVPIFARAYQEPTREAALQARALNLPTVIYKTYLPTFSVYRGQPTAQGLPQPGELVFIRIDKLPQLREQLPDSELSTVYARGGVMLLRRGAWSALMRIFTVPASTLADEADARWLLPLSAAFLIAAALLVMLAGWHGGFITINNAGRVISDWIAANLTQMGDTLFALSLFLLLAKRHPALLWHAVVAAIVAALLSRGIKAVMAEPRPVAVLDLDLFRQVGPLLRRSSFPSGHTVTALVSAATLACYVSWPWRVLVLMLALLVSASRVIVGAHWPIDVLGGAAIGVLSAYLGLLVARRWRCGLRPRVHLTLVVMLVLCTLVQLFRRPDYLDARAMVIVVSIAALAFTLWNYFIAARLRGPGS